MTHTDPLPITPRLICEDILKMSHSISSIKLAKRPWDRYRADNSSWWIVPSSDLVHYKYAKIYFANIEESKDNKIIKCGFFIEKGLSKNLSAIYSSKEAKYLIMDEKWSWNKICMKDELNTFLQELSILPSISNDLRINIEGGYVSEPTSFNPYDKKINWDKYVFGLETDKKIKIINSERKSFVLKLHDIDTLNALSEVIKSLSSDDWLWISLFVYVPIPVIDVSICSDIINSKYKDFFKKSLLLLEK